MFHKFLRENLFKRHTPHSDAPFRGDSSRGLDFFYLARFVGKLILFIINLQKCFTQNQKNSNILGVRVVVANQVFDNYVQVESSKKPIFGRFIGTD